ncbi:MAG: MFS transporter [Solirubrobacteraceae bacterium]
MATSSATGEELNPRRWVTFGFLLLASAMSLIDLTIVNIALPWIHRSLHESQAATEWIIGAYTLAFGLGLITGGRLGDIYGRRPVFVVGVVGFMAGSVVCGAAPTIWVLLTGRVIQAAFAAVMMPQVLGSVGSLFPPAERFKAMGLYGTVMAIASVIGPLFGAGILQLDIAGLHWRPMFFINVPIAIVAVSGAWRMLPDSRRPDAPRLDLGGVALLSAALVLLLYPLVEGRSLGWPAWTWAMLVASLPAVGLFVLHQSRRGGERSPLVPASLFAQRSFAGGLAVQMVFASGIAGYGLAVSLTLQLGLGFTPLLAAITGLPTSLGMAVGAQLTMKRLIARLPGYRLVLYGLSMIACGLTITNIVVHLAGAGLTNWDLIPGSLVNGFGMGIVAPILSGVVLSRVDPRDAGAGAGVLATGGQIGTSIGVAVIGAIFFGTLPSGSALIHDLGGGYTHALGTVLDYQVPLYVVCAILAAVLLPRPAKPAPAPVAAPAPVVAPAPAPAAATESEPAAVLGS